MIKKLKIELDVGLSDSELVSYQKEDSNLKVSIEAWNEQIINLLFSDVIYMQDMGAWRFSEFYELKDNMPIMQKVLSVQFEEIPHDHHYRHFQLLDIDGNSSFEVISESFSVEIK
ncbi:MAG: hypothetical protein PF692_14595 [Kiritimatiellae bacterium]|jgi:hypothetical protein|nr:hypothetical protein [Kiritimatiellia bacterium]